MGTGSDRSRLIRSAEEAGVAERVVFLDHVSEAQITELYRGALVYAMASTREGFPTTLIEAVLSGTPTLYFTDGPHPDPEEFQSDFFRVIHSLDHARVADAINRACSLTLDGDMDRHRIADWARRRFPPPEAVAGEIGRIYANVAESTA